MKQFRYPNTMNKSIYLCVCRPGLILQSVLAKKKKIVKVYDRAQLLKDYEGS